MNEIPDNQPFKQRTFPGKPLSDEEMPHANYLAELDRGAEPINQNEPSQPIEPISILGELIHQARKLTNQ